MFEKIARFFQTNFCLRRFCRKHMKVQKKRVGAIYVKCECKTSYQRSKTLLGKATFYASRGEAHGVADDWTDGSKKTLSPAEGRSRRKSLGFLTHF